MEKSQLHHAEHGMENKISDGSDYQRNVERDEVATLSPAHREYLFRRHGTVDLDPIPDMNDADPYNWQTWKVRFDFLAI